MLRGVQYETRKPSMIQLTPRYCYVLSTIKLANTNELVDFNSLLVMDLEVWYNFGKEFMVQIDDLSDKLNLYISTDY